MRVKLSLKISENESVKEVLKALDELNKETSADLEVELHIVQGISSTVEIIERVQKE